jgi:hypothetical protein
VRVFADVDRRENAAVRVPVVPNCRLSMVREESRTRTLPEPVVLLMMMSTPDAGMPDGIQFPAVAQELLVVPFQVDCAKAELVSSARVPKKKDLDFMEG